METIWNFIKNLAQPLWVKIVLIAVIAAVAMWLTACSRSTVAFKGTGDIEFYYKGTNGPTLDRHE